MPFLVDRVRRPLTRVALQSALLVCTAVVFPFRLRHPAPTVGFLIAVAAVAYLILTSYRQR